jgi:hypothetical protein
VRTILQAVQVTAQRIPTDTAAGGSATAQDAPLTNNVDLQTTEPQSRGSNFDTISVVNGLLVNAEGWALDPNSGKPLLFAGTSPPDLSAFKLNAANGYTLPIENVSDYQQELDDKLASLQTDAAKLQELQQNADSRSVLQKLEDFFSGTSQADLVYQRNVVAKDLQESLRYGAIVSYAQSPNGRVPAELFDENYDANIPVDTSSPLLADVNAVKEFATQFDEGVKGAEDVAGKIKEVSGILQMISGNRALQSTAAAVYTVASGVEEGLGKVAHGVDTFLKPFNVYENAVNTATDFNNKVLTPLTSDQIPQATIDAASEADVLQIYKGPNAAMQVGQAAAGLAEMGDSAAMSKVNSYLTPLEKAEQAIEKIFKAQN